MPAADPTATRPPPRRAVGPLAWLRRSFFAGPWSTAATLAAAALAAWAVPPLVRWAFLRAVVTADLARCREAMGKGACWGFVTEKHRLVLLGRYPFGEGWRPVLATGLVIAALLVTAHPRAWRRGLLALWAAVLPLFFLLMGGGTAGLPRVEPGLWGGLPLTVILTLVTVAVSIPLGVVLALGRTSRLPLARAAAGLYVELVRGVPLVTVLFVASFVFPLLLPEGLRLGVLWRIALGLVLFQAAYMAEIVRGGLAALSRGQREAAAAIGLSWWQTQRRVILPQALVLVIPSFVNSLLSTFMDTSLVTVVSLYDLTGSLRLALGDPAWRSFFLEGYLFVGAVYFAACLAMSRYGHWLEGRLGGWARRPRAGYAP